MADNQKNHNKPITLTSEGEKIDKIFVMAVKKALQRHKSKGNSVAIWRDGKVVILKADQIRA